MAKVISVKSYKGYHSQCGATVAFTKSEATKSYIKDYDGSGDSYYHFVCPNCGKEMSVIDYKLEEYNKESC